jgi:hypothetical protein
MKADNLIKLIQDVVRKEARVAVMEELARQAINENKTKPMLSSKSINTAFNIPSKTKSNNVLEDLINETRQNNEWKTIMNLTSADAQNFHNPMEYDLGTTTVENFINQAPQGVSDPRQVQINDVPDFSDMMKVMKNKGIV